MKTYMANNQTVERKWYIVDASGLTLGRLASKVANVLMGKHKTTYTPHVDSGDYVIVINCKDLVLTGNKLSQKKYFHYSGMPGGLSEVDYKTLMATKANFAFEQAIKGMLPKNSIGRKQMTRLKAYNDANYGHEAQKPIVLDLKEGENK
jgi:large subunit ribosomal protein L13